MKRKKDVSKLTFKGELDFKNTHFCLGFVDLLKNIRIHIQLKCLILSFITLF